MAYNAIFGLSPKPNRIPNRIPQYKKPHLPPLKEIHPFAPPFSIKFKNIGFTKESFVKDLHDKGLTIDFFDKELQNKDLDLQNKEEKIYESLKIEDSKRKLPRKSPRKNLLHEKKQIKVIKLKLQKLLEKKENNYLEIKITKNQLNLLFC